MTFVTQPFNTSLVSITFVVMAGKVVSRDALAARTAVRRFLQLTVTYAIAHALHSLTLVR